MADLPIIRDDRLLRALKRAGWQEVRITGSHHILTHPQRAGRTIVVAVHRRSMKRGTLADILKQAGLTATDLKRLL